MAIHPLIRQWATLLHREDARGVVRHSDAPSADAPSPEELEVLRALTLTFAICGAAANRDTIKFARAILDVLEWSAEHARIDALRQQQFAASSQPDWICPQCAEPNPATFDLCWHCADGEDVDRQE